MSSTGLGKNERVLVRCPTCRTQRTMAKRLERFYRNEGREIPQCQTCRRVGDVEVPEFALWYWLKMYGVTQNGLTAREHVELHGLPDGLRDLLDSLYFPVV